MSEKNLLDQMNLIDMKYVEAAQYPEGAAKRTGGRWWKAAVATAAALVIGVCSVSFFPQVRAFADEFLNAYVQFGNGQKAEGKMEPIHINEGINLDQVETKYTDIEDIEVLFGITMLHSSVAEKKPQPRIEVFSSFHSSIIQVTDLVYYWHDEVVVPNAGDGIITHVDGENPYHISYEATFFTDNADEETPTKGYVGIYDETELLETYTTANGLEANIYRSTGYGAIIYHNNIQYEFKLHPFDGIGDVETLKAFLDTLS